MLRLLKEYIDAKAEYDRYGLGDRPGPISPSASLTPAGLAIRDRYLAADRDLNDAIENEDRRGVAP